jgi:hypothetical protein
MCRRNVLFFKLEIRHDDIATERSLDSGAYVIGGGLQADLVVPALLDAELCEIILPETAGQAIKLKALVDGMVVNGREMQLGQSLSAKTLDILIDDVRLGLSASENEEPAGAPPATDTLTSWLEKSKTIMAGAAGGKLLSGTPKRDDGRGSLGVSADGPAQPSPVPEGLPNIRTHNLSRNVPELIQKNPGYALLGMAAVLGLLAFLVSGWPSAKLKPVNLVAKPGLGTSEREAQANLLQEIRRRLISADLGAFIKADPAANAIRLSGSTDPTQAARLDEIVKIVTKPGTAPLRNDVVMTSADAATGVESVVISPVKGIIASSGQLFNEGQIIPSGWLIEKIEPTQVTMKRDSITHVITMADNPAPPKMAVQRIPTPAKSTADMKRNPAATPSRGLESISTPPREQPAYPAPGGGSTSPQPRGIYR